MSEASSSTSKAKPRANGHVRIGLPELAWKVSSVLPRAERRALALRLLEAEADEITFRRQGTRWTAFVWDHVISGRLFIDGGFQEPEIRAVLAWMRRHGRIAASRDIIVDVGANVGTSTIPFALETDCRILAIEPIPEVFALLRRNIADNGLAARITCARAAISAAADQVQMVLPAGNSGGAEVCHRGHEPNFLGHYRVRDVVDVPAMALDKLLDVHDVAPERVAFVWSDTQGCEAEVIETGRRLWAVGVPLFAEFDPRTWDKTNGARALLAAATECFAGFIAAETLTAGAADKADPITELADFCRAMGPEGSDVLLLPEMYP
jgi:FkbM family methyltransferase